MERLIFATSVMHAYGHQWACQLLYHPRKREHFGLTDREGCERFWSSIKHLIPTLRVSGVRPCLSVHPVRTCRSLLHLQYHNRLYTLDQQVHFLRDVNMENIGRSVSRRYLRCMQKMAEALRQILLSGVQETDLRFQWQAQVQAQTYPKGVS